MSDIDVMDKLTECIALEAQVIDELFLLLSQFAAAEVMASLPCVEKIEHVTTLRKTLESEGVLNG